MSGTNQQASSGFIGSEGSLRVHLALQNVNWFEFYDFSRAMTATEGGWNSKTHWQQAGLAALLNQSPLAIERWTINSLSEDDPSLPSLRTEDFKFDRPDSRSHLDRNTPLSSASENEINYRLYKGKLQRLYKGKLQLNRPPAISGYEIPLSDDSYGQLKVDLVGTSEEGEVLELFELKRSGSTATPLLAFVQAICYGLQTLRCGTRLLRAAGIPDEALRRINLQILAPTGYWDSWLEQVAIDDLEMKFGELISRVNAGIAQSPMQSRFSVALGVLRE